MSKVLRLAPQNDNWEGGAKNVTPAFVGIYLRVIPRRMPKNLNAGMYVKQYYVYIMSSFNKVLYTGVTNDLARRVEEHRSKVVPSFTSKYRVFMLVFYEVTDDIHAAIACEKQIKGWRRDRKIKLIEDFNPSWRDLSREL